MGRVKRSRWQANVKSLEIINKARENITSEDIEFLKENYTSQGGLLPKGFNGGSFFTPTHVAKFIVDALQIPKGSRVLEPSCGSGVFFEHIPDDCKITGLELDTTSAKVASMIYPDAEVITGNALEHKRRDYYDFVIGNPPFGETIEVEGRTDFETLKYTKKTNMSKGKSEFAFVEFAVKAAKPGGYIAFILPMNFSFAEPAKKVRQVMYDTCWHVATVKLPPTTFQYVGTGVATQILILRKVTPNAQKIRAHPEFLRPYNFNGKRKIKYIAKFFEGQTPAYMAEVTDIGYGKDGKSTYDAKYGTQLDALLDDFTDGNLVRSSLYPHVPSWMNRGSINGYMFFNEDCEGYRDAKRSYADGPYRWNEITLGNGEGRSWDFTWQDEIVTEYYEKEVAS
ncbi:HsdM family class I SAM-dependent methyltransferase [Melghirimyces algeriensis]|uniref:N-6 DNA Methylase n=1 Tax=Melghirimyces algeriensis TaxID=910412 RepID=A0A521F714_9BACL|nr:N-6 DNA methylase [Melghirimyces algeriensis]SMO91982.1 N-6 DNA Methylase [Melghirimyces algeriensis]